MSKTTINWSKLWEIHAPHFKDGLSRIPLPNQKTLHLQPGPAFGDLSHPTTALSLSLLTPLCSNKILLDIGCGSGILSLGALLLGATSAYGYEIDPDSIEHAHENALLNHLEERFFLNQTPPKSYDLVVMNMISSEQRVALDAHPHLFQNNYQLITSGILKEERDEYLSKHPNRVLKNEVEQDGWMAFHFEHIGTT